jgi:tetratricopeptide (TPR) repeat protein
MPAEYDIFVSHAWADGDRPQQIADALTNAGLRVWFDAREINDFASITRAVTDGLAKSKALLAYYSKTYPLRRSCQWELTAAFLAAQTEDDPRRRVLLINPEKSTEHIHPIELRDAKFLSAPADKGAALQELIQSVIKHVATLKGALHDIRPLTAPNWYGMTLVGSTRFVGRLAEMWRVHSLLHATDVVQITGATVNIGQVSGLGGVGKSLLAEEYALQFGAAYPGGVFWLRAYGNDDSKTVLGLEAREALRAGQVRDMAERLGIDAHGMTEAQIEGALKGEIAHRCKDCLWVVDDVPNGLNGETLRGWFAPHALARTLITTRSREYGSLVNGIDLSGLAQEEAYQLLTSRKSPLGEAEQEHARELANDLGYHPLALDVTAAALQSLVANAPFADFRARLARPDKDALALAETLADALPNGHEKSITQTMLHSILNVGAEGRDFLRLASVLAVAPIPASLVAAVFEKANELSREDAEERAALAFKQVTSASLAEVAGTKQHARAVHTLVSRTVQFREARSERTQELRSAAVKALASKISETKKDPRLRPQVEFHVVHARQVIAIPLTVSEALLLGWVADYDLEGGAYASARALYERKFEFDRRVHGAEHDETLTSLNQLGVILSGQGDLTGARRLEEETLAIRRRVLGPKHPNTLISMGNLAATLWRLGDLAVARDLEEETLVLSRQVLGPEHPDVFSAMNNLAETLRTQGDLAGARKVHDEALALRRRVLGPEHPDTIISKGNLAKTLREQGDLAGSFKLQEGAVDLLSRSLGPEHPHVASALNNRAETLRAQGDLAGARKLHDEALTLRRRVLGPKHSDTTDSAWNLFRTLLGSGERAAAQAVLDRDLVWLLDCDPATLSADQRKARDYVAGMVKKSG